MALFRRIGVLTRLPVPSRVTVDHSILPVTSVYLRRVKSEADRVWPDVAVAIGV